MEIQLDWTDLPLIPVLHVFKYLNLKEILRVTETCKRWMEIIRTEEGPWRILCQKDWLLSPKTECFKRYREMYDSYSKYLSIYAPLKFQWDRLKELLSKNEGEEIVKSLLPG